MLWLVVNFGNRLNKTR